MKISIDENRVLSFTLKDKRRNVDDQTLTVLYNEQKTSSHFYEVITGSIPKFKGGFVVKGVTYSGDITNIEVKYSNDQTRRLFCGQINGNGISRFRSYVKLLESGTYKEILIYPSSSIYQ